MPTMMQTLPYATFASGTSPLNRARTRRLMACELPNAHKEVPLGPRAFRVRSFLNHYSDRYRNTGSGRWIRNEMDSE